MKSYLFILVALAVLLSSCSYATPHVGEEAVLVYQPKFFGKGGIDPIPIETGSIIIAPSTRVIYVKITPVEFEEQFENLMTKDKIQLSYTSYINLKVKSGQSATLLQNYGEDWYENSFQKKYRDIVRDVVSKFLFTELVGERDGVTEADSLIIYKAQEYINKLSSHMPFPIEVIGVSAGHISPSQGMLNEMILTSEEIQKAETLAMAIKNAELEIQLQERTGEAVKEFMKTTGCTFKEACQYNMVKAITEKEDVQVILSTDGNTSMLINPMN